MGLTKPIDAIDLGDIRALIEAGTSEDRSLDYKEQLPGGTDEERREFLADVSSFANAVGGYLLFGVTEHRDAANRPTGVASAAPGVGGNVEAETLRLESMIRDGIAPRVSGIRFRSIPGGDQGPILLCWVPKSWQAPHMVTFRNLSRFYSRGATGKYQLDVPQLREAFVASETLQDRIRGFRQERLAKILGDDTPIALRRGTGRIVLHLLPVAAMEPNAAIPASLADIRPDLFFGRLNSHRYNFDGVVGFAAGQDDATWRYVQVFRGGAIEGVDGFLLREPVGIPTTTFEEGVSGALNRYLEHLRAWGLSGPLLIMLSLLNVRGLCLIRDLPEWADEAVPIDRDHLVIPEIWLDELPVLNWIESARVLRPAFDVVWQSGGWPRSLSFDEAGEWNARR